MARGEIVSVAVFLIAAVPAFAVALVANATSNKPAAAPAAVADGVVGIFTSTPQRNSMAYMTGLLPRSHPCCRLVGISQQWMNSNFDQ